MEKTGTNGLFSYIAVFYTLLFDLVLFNETFSAMQVIGSAIVLGCNFGVVFLKYRKK